MNVDRILAAFHGCEVDGLLIGGMNFLLRHRPVNTFDVDFWVRDDPDNLRRVAAALVEIKASWGPTEAEWKPVELDARYLSRFPAYCLTSAYGAVAVFRHVGGLPDYQTCKNRSSLHRTANGTPYQSLADVDMLACQMALPPGERTP